jgi:hypothetical protein
MFDVRSEPVHADIQPYVGSPGISAVQCYNITS